MGRPRGGFRGGKYKKPPCPAVPRRGPEAGSPPQYEILMIFIIQELTPVHVRFNRAGVLYKNRNHCAGTCEHTGLPEFQDCVLHAGMFLPVR